MARGRATFEIGEIVEQEGEGGISFQLRIGFTYRMPDVYGGQYRESFRTRDEAAHMLRVFCEGPLMGRYNPTQPSDYFVDPYRDVREP